MQIKLATAMSDTYNINMSMLNGNIFSIAIDGTVMASASGRNNCLHMMLCGEALREFNGLASHNSGTTNAHLNHITDSLLSYLPQSMPYTTRSAQCVAQCVKLKYFFSRVSLHD